jgi:hypothetical protein
MDQTLVPNLDVLDFLTLQGRSLLAIHFQPLAT